MKMKADRAREVKNQQRDRSPDGVEPWAILTGTFKVSLLLRTLGDRRHDLGYGRNKINSPGCLYSSQTDTYIRELVVVS